MALAVVASGTQTATVGTEHDLATSTTGKIYVLKVDCAALAGAEIVTLRVYSKVLSGGTERLVDSVQYAAATLANPIVESIPYPENIHIRATLEQTGGTGRAFPWSLLSLD